MELHGLARIGHVFPFFRESAAWLDYAMTRLKEELEQLRIDETRYTREGNYDKAAEIKYGRIPQIEKELEAAVARREETQKSDSESQRLLRQEVSEEDIARVVSTWTGIPVSKMLAGERQKYLDWLFEFEYRLQKRPPPNTLSKA